jgi:ketosteroid isomerase-like protein
MMEANVTEKQTIIDLEKKFWDTMVSKDADAATEMMAKRSIVIGPQGVSQISRGDFSKMMEEGKWTLDSYKFSDVQVIFPDEGTAVIGYKVRQKGTMSGKPYDMEAADASTWTKSGGEWLCVMHSETVLESAEKKAA